MDESNNHNDSEPGATMTTEATFEVPAGGESRGHGGGFLFGVLAGTFVGAGLATILTPARGEEVRARAAEKAPELWHRREELAREAREKAREVAGTARSRVGEAMEAGREAAQEAQQEAHRRFEQMTGRRSGPPYP
jgi:gas vesicle protein